ncbi:MAG: hypothetical protein Q8904_08835 [Bacteroidota bacterium]|nr:hypothetical protein [Bacteroidota bacterium]
MRYIITFCLLVVTLFAGAATTSISKSEISVPKHLLTSLPRNSSPDHHHTRFNSGNLFFDSVGNEQIRLTNSLQHLSFRILPSFSKASRVRYSNRLDQQKFITGHAQFLLKAAFNQTTGYYLYHLHKLLI